MPLHHITANQTERSLNVLERRHAGPARKLAKEILSHNLPYLFALINLPTSNKVTGLNVAFLDWAYHQLSKQVANDTADFVVSLKCLLSLQVNSSC